MTLRRLGPAGNTSREQIQMGMDRRPPEGISKLLNK